MPNENELQIIFGADTAPLQKEVKKATGIVDQFGNEIKKTADQAAIGFERVRKTFAGIPKATDALSRSTAGLKSNTNAAALALNDISRIAQDVPFGFIGIQNNINPMLESFRRLRAETGSTGGALKALAGSLVGAGGLGLAFGVVSAALTIYQNGIAGFNRKTKEASKTAETLADNLKSIDEITNSGRGSVAGDIASVEALARGLKDTNKSYSERKNILESLKSVNADWFGDMTLEESKLASLTGRIKEYSAALVQSAITNKFKDQIADVAVKLGEADKQTNAALKSFENLQNQLAKKFPAGQPKAPKAETGSLTATVSVSGIDEALDEYNKLFRATEAAEENFLKLNDVSRKLSINYAELNDGLNTSISLQSKYKSVSGGTHAAQKREIDLLKIRKEALQEIVDLQRRDLDKNDVFVSDAAIELKNLEIKLIRRDGKEKGFSQQEIDDIIRQQFPEFETGLKYSKPVAVTAAFQFDVAQDVDPFKRLGETFDQRFPALAKKFKDAGDKLSGELKSPFEKLNASIKGIIENTIVGFGEALGDVLSGADPVKAFVSVIADAIDQLGKALIAFGVFTGIAENILKSAPNPFAAIAAGVAAVAAGKLLKNQLNKTHKFGDGGIVMGPTLGMLGEAGPEMVIPLNRSNQFIDGFGSLDISGDLRIRGNDLVLALNRATATRNKLS